MAEEVNEKWSGKTGGTPRMQHALMVIYRLVGLRPMYMIMALVVPFYMLFSHKGYIACYRFFRRRLDYGILKSFVNVYRNHYVFGKVIIDRFAVYAGKKFDIDLDGYYRYRELTHGKDGFVMVSSHVGNYEISGYTIPNEGKTINALVFDGETAEVMNNRQRVLGNNNIRLVPIKEDLSHVFIMNTAIANGEIVSMSGDRVLGQSKTVDCTFFGQQAHLPMGPFLLAAQRECSILAVFAMKEHTDSYHVYIKELQADKSLKARERTQQLAQHFANELEAMVRRYPTQWFNYYDFWE